MLTKPEKFETYFREEMDKTMFIMKGIDSMGFEGLLFPHPAIRNFMETANRGDIDILGIARKMESDVDIEPKELFKIMHFLCELFEAADEAYDVFLNIANNFKGDSDE